MSSTKVAVVTGSSSGIGYAIVKGLCEKFDGTVYLTSKYEGKGRAAVDKLKKLGFNPAYHQLDVLDQISVDTFRNYLKETHGGLDVLINNAAIVYHMGTNEPVAVQVEKTINVNYYGTLRICQSLFPLLRHDARVVNISSYAGKLSKIPSMDLRASFSKKDLTIPQLNKLMETYVEAAKDDRILEEGWGSSSYAISKVALTALTFIQQRQFDAERPNRNVAVNAVHPGFINTAMATHKGALTTEEGARAPLFLALESDFKGQFVWNDCSTIDWYP